MIGLLLLALWPCSGHVTLAWDYTDGTTPADYFEVDRQVHGDPPTWAPIGQTRTLNRVATWEYTATIQNPDGTVTLAPKACSEGTGCPCPGAGCTLLASADRLLWWPILRGSRVPVEGVVYDYRARAVADTQRSIWSNVYQCLPPSGPTKCYTGGAEVPCP